MKMFYCEGGSQHKHFKKITLKTGDIVKRGQWVRIEETFYPPPEDDVVKAICNIYSQNLCKLVGDYHLTYYYVSNTRLVLEQQAIKDTTIEVPPSQTAYLLLTFWETYKIPIIIGTIGAISTLAGIITYKKHKTKP
jgi:hypothetical protein